MKIRIIYNWTGEAHCPICKNIFTGWYCPSCGLPKKNSKYTMDKDGHLHNCDRYHFRPEFSSFEDFKLCDKCYTTNPLDAKYCRNCGHKFDFSKGVTKNAHGWVDLGLSVLWSTEEMRSRYMWMRTDGNRWMDISFEEYKQQEVKDSASFELGHKWRTPTKEEFEELIDKCTWEKVFVWENRNYPPYFEKYQRLKALKVTGPNGNHIIVLPNVKNAGISYWTATKSANREGFAHSFDYSIRTEDAQSEEEKELLWLSTPIDKNKDICIREHRMQWGRDVRPVADKKWQGKL